MTASVSEEAFVPTVNNLSFYSDANGQKTRYDNVSRTFRDRFGTAVDFVARAPGRVNLIGEHIDYCHFSVLPMAIEVDVIAAVALRDDQKIVISNTDPKFEDEVIEIPLDGSVVSIDLSRQLWGNYFKCGLIVAHKYMLEKKPLKLKGFNVLFDGTVPTGGGLSSSAAFCIAATLACLKVNGFEKITKADLTEITVVCEHYVGLNNGGMDQSASINGEDSKVLLISFKPKLEAVAFKLPATNPDTVFLITNSLITANKTETAPTNYNLRVVEVAIAADLITNKFGVKADQDSNLETATLRGAFDAYFTQKLGEPAWDGKDIQVGIDRLQRMLKVVDTLYSDEEKNGITTERAAEAVGLTLSEFREKYLSKFEVRYNLLNAYRRTVHVYGDALRVLQTLQVARSFSGDSEKFFKDLGELMDESQVSTRELNNASAPGCDELCQLGRANGSYGSRVTGAGFGGSIVHLTNVEKLPELRQALVEQYYKKNFPGISDAQIADAIVVSKPTMGACIYE